MDDNFVSKMSQRLLTAAGMLGMDSFSDNGTTSGVLRKFDKTADVGCDHGYVSMYLVKMGISSKAIAMDVREGPLSAAKANISEYGFGDRIEVRLSDGLNSIKKGEVDSLIIAGMGGKLMMSILDKGNPKALLIKMGVLQPQSDIDEFRAYLREKGYVITDERIVWEDGKYYFPMLVCFDGSAPNCLRRDSLYKSQRESLYEILRRKTLDQGETIRAQMRIFDRYGEFNILRRDPLLLKYLEHGKAVAESILRELDRDSHVERFEMLEKEISDIEVVLSFFKERAAL